MAVVLYLVSLPIWACGVVHQHYIVVHKVLAHQFLIEQLRRIHLWCMQIVAVRTSRCPCKLSDRFAQAGGKHVINLCQHLFLHLLQLGCTHVSLTQTKSVLAQLTFHIRRELTGVVGSIVLGHHTRRHKTILRHEVCHTSECAAIAQRVLEQPLHCLVVHRTRAGVNHCLQEEVRLLKLVVEEQIDLRELQSAQFVTVDNFAPQHVKPSKKPTPSRRLLVGDAFRRHTVAEVSIHLCLVVLIECNTFHVCNAERITHSTVGRCQGTIGLQTLQQFSTDTLRPYHRCRKGERKKETHPLSQGSACNRLANEGFECGCNHIFKVFEVAKRVGFEFFLLLLLI